MQRILQPGEIESLDRTALPRIRLPQPGSLFLDRSQRLQQLADGNPVEDFLRYVARLMAAQHQVLKRLPAPVPPEAAVYERAQRYAMPVWQLPAALDESWRLALDGLLSIMRAEPGSEGFQASQIDALQAMDERSLLQLAEAVMAGAPLNEARRARAPFVMAAVQVAMSRRAAALDPGRLPYVDPPTVCPVCSSQPVASVIRIDGQHAGLRYLHCAVCATEWHMVRVKCSNCASTAGISYRSLGERSQPGGEATGAVACMAELCDACGSYRKLFDLQKDHGIEVMSDDLATLMLDILMGEENHARAGLNPFLYMNPDPGEPGEGAGGPAQNAGAGLPAGGAVPDA